MGQKASLLIMPAHPCRPLTNAATNGHCCTWGRTYFANASSLAPPPHSNHFTFTGGLQRDIWKPENRSQASEAQCRTTTTLVGQPWGRPALDLAQCCICFQETVGAG